MLFIYLGMAHSNQVREFLPTDHGVDWVDVYLGASGVLTGSARAAQEARERAEDVVRAQTLQAKPRELERKRRILDDQIASLKAEFEPEEAAFKAAMAQEKQRERVASQDRSAMAALRQSDNGKRPRK